jgi:hypothetical protein
MTPVGDAADQLEDFEYRQRRGPLVWHDEQPTQTKKRTSRGGGKVNGDPQITMDVTPSAALEPQAKRLEKDAEIVVLDAQSIEKIRTAEEMEVVKTQVGICNKFIEEAEAFFAPIKKSMDAAKKVVLDREKAVVGPVKLEKERLRGLQAEYAAWVRKEQEAAERIRILAIQKAHQEAEEKARKEREEALAAARDLREEGDDLLASKLEEAAGEVTAAPIDAALLAPAPAPVPLAVEGVSFREKLYVEVVDESLIPRKWLKPDIAGMEEFVRKVGKDLAKDLIPGIAIRVEMIPVNKRS